MNAYDDLGLWPGLTNAQIYELLQGKSLSEVQALVKAECRRVREQAQEQAD